MDVDGRTLLERTLNRLMRSRAAFLVLERERRVLAARLHRAHRHRSDRYRDLILITKLIRLEHEHLIGQVGPSATSLPEALPAFSRERLEDWAQPWGVGPMFELRTEFIDYRHQCHRLAKWLSAASRARAAAEAERHLDGIFMSSGFETVPDELELEAEHERASVTEPDSRLAEAAGGEPTAEQVRPWGRAWVTQRSRDRHGRGSDRGGRRGRNP